VAVGRHVTRVGGRHLTGTVLLRQLRLVGRPLELHAGYLTAAATAGFLGPFVIAVVAVMTGVAQVFWPVPLIASLVAAALAIGLVQVDLVHRADDVSRDLRHQLSAYLDVLTMLLAANQGNEGALRLAAEAGDGRLFLELRRRMLETATAGRPSVTALTELGRDLGVVELVEIAANASLATSQGAPVGRSLRAKTQSLRAGLQAEQEQDARIRTGKITFPLVAMGIVFMIMGLYPAVASIQQH